MVKKQNLVVASQGGLMAICLIKALRVLLWIVLILSSAWVAERARAQVVVDEARQAGRAAQTFPAADEDYFQAMDGGITLTPDEVKAATCGWCGPAETIGCGTS